MKRSLPSAIRGSFKICSASPLKSYIKPPKLVTHPRTIRTSDLEKLFRHEITALHIQNFHPPVYASKLGKELADLAKTGQVDNWRVGRSDGRLEASDVFTMGEYIPYNVAVATGTTDEYFDGVEKDFRKRRFTKNSQSVDENDVDQEQEHPRLWPLDQLRLELDECWPHGAGLARDKNTRRVLGGGLPRIMIGPTRSKKGFIHADQYSPLSFCEGLFSGNIYLQLPDNDKKEGEADEGELHIWNLEMYNDIEWFQHQDLLKGMTVQDAEMQIKLRKALGDPLKIHVKPGDLVLFCVQKPHCAVGFMNGIRVSLQCFIQYRQEERLLIDI